MLEAGAAKGAGFFAALASAASPEAIKTVLRFDPETVCGIILLFVFVAAPLLMQHDYITIMGPVVSNAWSVVLVYLAPLSGKLSERVAGAVEKINKAKSNGQS